MRKRGTTGWIPSVVIEEMEDIKRTDGLNTDSEALKRMVDNSRTGRTIGKEIAEINKKLPSIFKIGKKKRRLF